MIVWSVFEARAGSRSMWAWCRGDGRAAGFRDITYTASDGFSFVDPGDVAPTLSTHLFTFTVPGNFDDHQGGNWTPPVHVEQAE